MLECVRVSLCGHQCFLSFSRQDFRGVINLAGCWEMLYVRLPRMDASRSDRYPVTDGSKGGGVLVKLDSLKIGPVGCSVNRKHRNWSVVPTLF